MNPRAYIAAAQGAVEGFTAGLFRGIKQGLQERRRRRALLRIRAAYTILGVDVARLSDEELCLMAIATLTEPPKDTDRRYTFRIEFRDGRLQLNIFELLAHGQLKEFRFGPIPLDRRGAINLGRALLDHASRVVNIHEARAH